MILQTMRIHPLCSLLLLPTLVASTLFDGCKVEYRDSTKLIVQQCDHPLTLSEDSFVAVYKNLTTLKIARTNIERIDNAFSRFDELDTILIEDSTIGTIHADAFVDLPMLVTLTFVKTTFRESPVISSEYLEELIFNQCKLIQVPNVDNLRNLNFLNLENNLITEIPESAFNKLESIDEVKLSNNSITSLPPNLFSHNADFTNLNLDDNPLTSFFINFISPLENLSLKNCNLTVFDRQITNKLAVVSNLVLSGNKLSVLSIDVFEPMKDLSDIDLSNNNFVELDDAIFYENSKLEKIIMDNNNLFTLPKFQSRDNFPKTTTFSCKNCGLTTINGVFDQMSELTFLDLSNNKLTNIDGLFATTSTLQKIFLSNNLITAIGIDSFGTNSALQELDLSNNPLSPLDPVVLATLPRLKKLKISGSHLKQLWANYNAVIPALENLQADKNELSTITVNDVKIIPNLKVIALNANPMNCTDEVHEFLTYAMTKKISSKTNPTHLELRSKSELIASPAGEWASVFLECDPTSIEDDLDNTLYTDENKDYDEDDDEYEDVEEKDDLGVEASVVNISGFNLAKASYILSITSVFILTALLVLFVAVVITLLILKRNKSFNIHKGDLPRLKIPLWHTTPGHKKHSGSVYKPLSEDLSSPRTPIINRYEFKKTPQVHNSLP